MSLLLPGSLNSKAIGALALPPVNWMGAVGPVRLPATIVGATFAMVTVVVFVSVRASAVTNGQR